MALHPVQVVEAHGAAGHNHEALFGEARDGQIALDGAARGQHGGVGDGTDRSVHPVGCQALQHGERAGPGHLEYGEGRQIEESHPFPRGRMFGRDCRGPFLCSPTVAGCAVYIERFE